MPTRPEDAELAARLATTAGDLLLAIRAGGSVGGKGLGVLGDAVSHEYLVRALADARPGDRVLSEEGDRERTGSGSRVWIVDPLDGTREYAEGRSDWAVHVALVEDGAVAAAAVALPGEGVTCSSATPPPPLPLPLPGHTGATRIVVSRSRPPAVAEAVAQVLDAELVPMGSAGAKILAVCRGEVEAYIHAGGQYEWDSAAPVGVALAAGLHASRLDGSPLRYDNPDPYLPDLLVCRPDLADRLLAAIADAETGRANAWDRQAR
ncbi:MAG TPA: 3'(2'),5'-bisphosphate nucleotidase CysQ [Amycolatopsis sp.]|nr:3'(2'),5'-bisphosphate nucleotidase CysQ [Amycolatopsis sp.]